MMKTQLKVDRKGRNKYDDDYEDGSGSENEEDQVYLSTQ
jgi:hypothetical protein